MRISPQDIKETTFSRSLRGYDVRLVNQYLYDLANDFQNQINENEQVKLALAKTEMELNRLKEVETLMLVKIKEAEQNAQVILENAQKAAEEIVKEANKESNKLIIQGRAEATKIKENAEDESERLLAQTNETINKIKSDTKADLAESLNEYNSLDLAKQQLIADLNSLIDLTHGRLSDIRTKYSPDTFDPKKVEKVPLATLTKPKNKKEDIKQSLEKTLDEKIAQKNKKVSTAKAKPSSKKVETAKVKPKAKTQKADNEEYDGLPTVEKILQNNDGITQSAVTIPPPRMEKEAVSNNFFDNF